MASPFGLQDNPPEGARTISSKAPPPPKMALATIQIFGEYQVCQDPRYSPALPGHRPAFKAGFVFLGLGAPRIAAQDCVA